jgi:uncharacterized protein (TIGR02996 family)
MTDGYALLRAIEAHPDDDTPRLVYADWLDEHGQPERADYLRAECALANAADKQSARAAKQRLAELHPAVDVNWRAAVSRTRISLCQASVQFHCPQHWDDLRPTGDARVRFCETCKENVVYCDSLEQAGQQANAGRCVVVEVGVPHRVETHFLMGRFDFSVRRNAGVLFQFVPPKPARRRPPRRQEQGETP